MLASSNGILGQSMEGMKKALMEGYDSSLHFVEYKDLVNNPKETIEKIYDFLDEESFEHTFDNLKNENRENDAQVYGFADMHEVRPKLKSISKDPEKVLSKDIIERCKGTEFWRVLEDDYEEDNYEPEEDDQEESNLIGI
jgi:sulfotransferase